MHRVLRLVTLLCLAPLAMPALAANTSTADNSPVGTWNQVDDNSGKTTSIIRITNHDGELQATVLKVMNMSPEQIARDGNPPMCTQCDGKRHNQPIEGMVIMWGVHKDGDQWNGGHILDPTNGKTYKVKLSMADHGQKLKVRGYIGFSLFGRTQVWQRVKTKPKPAAKSPTVILLPATSSTAAKGQG